MSKRIISKPLTIALGSALVGGLAATAASADATSDNPFAMEELDTTTLIAGAHEEGGCGEDKEGGEGKCGEDKEGGEGKCGEGKCGGSA